MLTVVKLADVTGEPKFKLDLPSLRVGDPVRLPALQVRRETLEGRHEVLDVESRIFRITAVGLDASSWPFRQLLSVEVSLGRPPTWRSVKKPPEGRRRLPPAIFPRTPV